MALSADTIKQAAKGKWHGILQSMAIEVPGDPKKHAPCPACGGKDRFRFDDQGEGMYFCNGCGAGDGISLVQKALGMTFPEALGRINEVVGTVEFAPPNSKPPMDEGKIREMLNSVWKNSSPLKGSDIVSQYLRSRSLMLTPNDVRYCPSCYESKTKTKMPAMVALVRNPEGIPVTIHRTYLGGPAKAKIESPKKIMPCAGRLQGAAARLFPPKDDLIAIAEGVETAIAATQLWDIPTWAALTTSILESFIPPPPIRRVVIFADCDPNFAGAKSAYTLANKLYLKDYIVDVQVPDLGDWNDQLIATVNR